jgi:tRNA-2-methylthio-N6-dimethylallyladenosine synthase
MTGTPDVFPPATPGGTPLVALPAGPRKPDQVKGKLYIKTHGCQMNEYDSAKMADVLAASDGLELTDSPDDADVILVNTCSIREKAQEKVFSQLGVWKGLKNKGREVIIGVGGCVASQEGEAIIKRAPFVDLVFGPQTLHRLPELIRARREQKRPQVDISFPEIEKFDRLPEPRAEGPRRSCRSWKAAPSTARSAWCPTPAAPKSAARSRTWWWKWRSWPRRACARSTCSGRTSTPIAGPMATASSPTSAC